MSGISIRTEQHRGDGQCAHSAGWINAIITRSSMVAQGDSQPRTTKYRYVPLDIFPSETSSTAWGVLLGALPRAMEGDAIGGAVNIGNERCARPVYIIRQYFTGLVTSYSCGGSSWVILPEYPESKSPYEQNGNQHNATPEDFSKNANQVPPPKTPLPNLLGSLCYRKPFHPRQSGILDSRPVIKTRTAGSNSLFDSGSGGYLRGNADQNE